MATNLQPIQLTRLPLPTLRSSSGYVFLDRDGVIVENRHPFISSLEDIRLVPGAAEAIAKLISANLSVVVVTNQAPIGRGELPVDVALRLHNLILECLEERGVSIPVSYICPHAAEAGCPCRKPKSGMLLAAFRDLGLDPAKRSWMIGDSGVDIACGLAIGSRALLVPTDRTEAEALQSTSPENTRASLAEAADSILAELDEPRMQPAVLAQSASRPRMRKRAAIQVITVTRGRHHVLPRAIDSVQGQTCQVSIEHLIVVDDCAQSARFLTSIDGQLPRLRWIYAARRTDEHSGPGRLARLRNMAVAASSSPWVAFLDDDNEWETDHLEELFNCAQRSGARAVHSHMQLRNRDGSLYLDECLPWSPSREEGEVKYRQRVAEGVMTPGSSIVRDRADPLEMMDGVQSVDAGEWLLARSLLEEVSFPECFTEEDERLRRGDDDKFLNELLRRRETIVSSDSATLIYYLGGFSTDPTGQGDLSFRWR